MTQLELSLFGGFAASVENKSITQFRTDKMRALLAYLALNEERPFRRESLATLLWSEWPDDAARRNLRQTLHRLRQLLDKLSPELGSELLTMTRQTVQLNGTAVSLDVARFQQHLQTCETHPHVNLHQCDACLARMQQAAAIYQGDLLDGFSLKDAYPFEEWLLVQREQHQQQMLALLDQLTQALEQRGEFEQAQQFANQQVQLAPWRESAHRQLMRLYMRQDQRTAALAQYETCRHMLEQELGVEPAEETVQLWQQIKNGTWETAVSPHTPLHNFPPSLTLFIGREQEIAQILAHLADDGCRLLTLLGPGGTGKTRLSVQVGQEIGAGARHYQDGAFFIPLAAVSDETRLVTTLAQHLNLQLTEQTPPRQQLLNWLQAKELLLVCDNFEQLMSGAGLLGDILAQAPGVQILVTSRQPLNLQAEWRQPVGGLDYREGDSSEAVRFFRRCARRVAPQFKMGEEDVTAVLNLCRLVDGLPLALEIAAAWTRLMDCPTILRETQKSLDFLASPLGDLPDRHQSIRAVLNQSWQMLTQRLQIILGQLALFAGSFTLNAALSIVPDLSMLDLASLLDRSLLQWQPNGRYQMHELLRQFAQEQFQAELTIFRGNYGRFYLNFIADQESQLRGKNPQQAVAAIQQELDNVRQAWQWTVAQQDDNLLAAALDGLAAFHQFRGTYDEGREQFVAAAKALPPSVLVNRLWLAEADLRQRLGDLAGAVVLVQRVVDTEFPETRLPALISLGRLYEQRSEYDLAIGILQEALKQAEPQSREAAQIWSILGSVYGYRGPLEKRIAAHKQALAVNLALEDELQSAETYYMLGMIYKDTGAYDQAMAHIEQAIAIAERLNHRELIARFTYSLGVIYWRQDELDQAQVLYEQALSIVQELNHKRLISFCLGSLGVLAKRRRNYDEALRYYQQAVQLAEQMDDKSTQAIYLGNIGNVYMDLGQYEDAINYLKRAAELDRKAGALGGVARHYGNIGDTLKYQRRYKEAVPYYEEAIPHLRQIGANYFLCWVLVSYAECLFELGRLPEAQAANAEGGKVAAEIGRDIYQMFSLLLDARIQAKNGNVAASVAQVAALRERFTMPEMLAEIAYTLWQINGDPASRADAEVRLTALYKDTKRAHYRTRFIVSGI